MEGQCMTEKKKNFTADRWLHYTSSFPVNFLHKSAQACNRVKDINMLLLFPLLVGLFRFESQSEAQSMTSYAFTMKMLYSVLPL